MHQKSRIFINTAARNLNLTLSRRGFGGGGGLWSEVSFKDYMQNFSIRHGPAYKKIRCAIWVSIRQCVSLTRVPRKIVGQKFKNFETSTYCEKKIEISLKNRKKCFSFSDTHISSLQINYLPNNL